MARLLTAAEIAQKLTDNDGRSQVESDRQIWQEIRTLIYEQLSASTGGAVDATNQDVVDAVETAKSAVDALATQNLSEFNETQAKFDVLQAFQAVEFDESQALLAAVRDQLIANGVFDDAGIISMVQVEGDQTQAKLDLVISSLQGVPNGNTVTAITAGAVGAGLRAVSLILLGGGAGFSDGAGTINGISVPIGYATAVDADGSGTLSNDFTLTATGGAQWVATIKS